MQKWFWPLEDEYGTVNNVPEDDPRLKLLRLTMTNPNYSDERLEATAIAASANGKLNIGNRNGAIENHTPTAIDELIWKLHVEGRANTYIATVSGCDLQALRKKLKRLKSTHHDQTDYVKRQLTNMVANGDSVAKMMLAVGYKYRWVAERALKRYGLED
ncbi:hypothetical protein [Lacticaseibacillus nasuensis]|nr:hypothetical protein [Lacticaseibacillus nasuensis]